MGCVFCVLRDLSSFCEVGGWEGGGNLYEEERSAGQGEDVVSDVIVVVQKEW